MPRYTTQIPTRGPNGNIFAIIGNCARLMRELGHSPEEVSRMQSDATAAGSYAGACAIVEKWFPLTEEY